MSTVPATPVPIYLRPWSLLLTGLVIIGAGWLIGETTHLEGPRFVLVLAGTAVAYVGIVHRLRAMNWALPGRIESALMVSLSGLGAFVAYNAMDRDWVSGRMFFAAIFMLSLVGAILLVLPPLARRVAISLVVVFHLLGIVTAVTVVDPPGGTGPWVSQQLMGHVYRPYLSFLYMTNAYHFYSPDPGVPSVLWFAVHYSDGKYAWLRIPNKADSPMGMHYQRMLALPEHTFNPMGRLPLSEAELRLLEVEKDQRPIRGSWEDINKRRLLVGSTRSYHPDGKPIPMVSDLDIGMQYQEPTEPSKRQITSVVRHVFRLPRAQREGVDITSIKVYRVKMNTLTPYELSLGYDPMDRLKWLPYFLGEFDAEGELLHPRDPLLYWYLPIVRVGSAYPDRPAATLFNGIPYVNVRREGPKDGILLDCMEMHASTPSPEEQAEEKPEEQKEGK